jgi:hypothetical protein
MLQYLHQYCFFEIQYLEVSRSLGSAHETYSVMIADYSRGVEKQKISSQVLAGGHRCGRQARSTSTRQLRYASPRSSLPLIAVISQQQAL